MPPEPTEFGADVAHPDILAALGRFAQSPAQPVGSFAHAEFEIALLIARIIDPDMREDETRAALADLLQRADREMAPWGALAAIGFAGNSKDYESQDNSAIHHVIERRTGIPITLAVLVIELARARGLTAYGVNQPGHFLVRVGSELVDPFHLTLHPGDGAALAEVPPVTPVAFGVRMLNNLKYAKVRGGAWHQALTLVQYQLALLPHDPWLLGEQGEYWSELGAYAVARDCYQRALQHLGRADSKLKTRIDLRLAKLPAAGSETLH